MESEEVQRLAALHRYQVLNPLPDEALERLTRMARQLLRVQVAVLTLVDARRIWVKCGAGTGVRELDRVHSCCARTIEGDGVFAVPDLRTAPHFLQDRLVQGEGVCSYAGAPLITPDGFKIGTLAVYDHSPRTFTADERVLLLDLATVVIDALELRLTALQREDAQRRAEYLAHHDALTGLPNRLRFLDRAEQALRQADRVGHPAAFMVLDLNRFKTINDSYGHAVGDELLKVVAERLCAAVRAEDTVARFGGDEFMVLLPDLLDPLGTARVAQKLLAAFDTPFHIAGHVIHMSPSIGISLYPLDGQDAATLLRAADTAMYGAKASRTLRYCFYTEAMTEAAQAKVRLHEQLIAAISAHELKLHYQPQVDLRTGEVVGVEALLRWPQPDGSMIEPSQFLPLAEESRLIVPLGDWVLREACAQVMRWRDMGGPEWDVAVNVSARQWEHPDFLASVQRALSDTRMPASRLLLEVTEGALLSNPNGALSVAAQLAKLGVRVALDDFGTGYANLQQLRQLDVGQLKVDRSFVQDVLDTKAMAIASTVMTLGHQLGMRVVGEGVETDAQREALAALACDVGQGYLFARPLAPEELERQYFSHHA